MGRLDNKVAIVTGAASGFGEGIAKHFAEEGARVLVCDINAEAGERVAAAASEASEASEGRRLRFQALDVTRRADWDAAVARAVELWGRVDVLVNNAGTSYANKSTHEVSEDEFDRVMSVNVRSVFLGSNAFNVQAMKQRQQQKQQKQAASSASAEEGQGGGDGDDDGDGEGYAIINIASVGAHRPRPGLVWYNASKAAICNATMGLAAEYGPHGIRVNSICPLATMTGLLPTFIGREITPDVRRALAGVPLGRMGEIRDVTRAAVFLASADASFVTGVNLDVDGGRAI